VTAARTPLGERAGSAHRGWPRWWPLMGALAYAAVLALMPGERFRDRDNYLAYLENAPIFMLGWLDGNVLQILANEPLWILINAGLGLTWPHEQALRLLIFVPAVVVAQRMFAADPRHALLLLAFMLLPQVLKNHVIHLRQGLAVAVFLMGWFAATRRWRWGFWLLTPWIHSSFFFVLLLLVLTRLLQRWRAPLAVAWACFVTIGVAIGLGLGELARAAGARQGEEMDFTAAEGISGLGFLFWLTALGLLMLQSRAFLRQHLLEVGTVLFYLATYFLSPFTARVFESTLPLVLLAGLRMRGPGRLLFLSAMLALGALQWLLIYVGGRSIFTEA
jgi:hypothetical protein